MKVKEKEAKHKHLCIKDYSFISQKNSANKIIEESLKNNTNELIHTNITLRNGNKTIDVGILLDN